MSLFIQITLCCALMLIYVLLTSCRLVDYSFKNNFEKMLISLLVLEEVCAFMYVNRLTILI